MKKMRKLLPAFAMLLVSAIMMSTASFAWFTMNQEVTATGMSVQAQAGGSMVISTDALTELSKGITVDFATTASRKITPITYKTVTADTTDVDGWVVPKSDATIDPLTGANESDTWANAELSAGNGGNYLEYVVYIGLAGDSEKWNVQVTLTTASELSIAGAYAVAFYVDNAGDAATALDAVPDLILHVANGVDGAVNVGKLFDEAVDIPSTVGVDGTDVPAVGIRVTMRVFVDGNLKNGNQYTPKKAQYTLVKGEEYSSATTYYVKNGEKYELAAVENVYQDGDVIAKDWYTYSLVDDDENKKDLYYVNNSNAPAAPTGLNVEFALVDKPAA